MAIPYARGASRQRITRSTFVDGPRSCHSASAFLVRSHPLYPLSYRRTIHAQTERKSEKAWNIALSAILQLMSDGRQAIAGLPTLGVLAGPPFRGSSVVDAR
jgi:hypothetical protein